MLNKYPEIWLRESVMLVDLQTSSIFSLSPPFFLPFLSLPCPSFSSGPVSAYKRATVQRKETGLRHSTQLLLISLHSEDRQRAHLRTLTHTAIQAHTHKSPDIRSPVRSRTAMCSQLIFQTVTIQHSLIKKRNKRFNT